ncbi:MAG: [Fe-Fe] hydrogenase large subunit C-terminal domain-containing protein, partial [Candidatus Gracilibacteria bacterium]|nr:[Fe-Fe] hydrogenase large subunit C-terminal domain-containing protein [Candidatus Gracilibacteria bacterium]
MSDKKGEFVMKPIAEYRNRKNLLFTDKDKCDGCASCLKACPVVSANHIINMGNNKKTVQVNNNACIRCGVCLKACDKSARYYVDDTQKFLDDLDSGKQISLIVGLEFALNHPNKYKKVFGWLKKKGISGIYSTVRGEDLLTSIYLDNFTIARNLGNSGGRMIASTCPVIVNFVERHVPKALKYLAPYKSYVVLAAEILRIQKIEGDFAFLSSCIARSDEFDDESCIKYNVTIEKLMEHFGMYGDKYVNEVDFDPVHYMPPYLHRYGIPGSLRENLRICYGDNVFVL